MIVVRFFGATICTMAEALPEFPEDVETLTHDRVVGRKRPLVCTSNLPTQERHKKFKTDDGEIAQGKEVPVFVDVEWLRQWKARLERLLGTIRGTLKTERRVAGRKRLWECVSGVQIRGRYKRFKTDDEEDDKEEGDHAPSKEAGAYVDTESLVVWRHGDDRFDRIDARGEGRIGMPGEEIDPGQAAVKCVDAEPLIVWHSSSKNSR